MPRLKIPTNPTLRHKEKISTTSTRKERIQGQILENLAAAVCTCDANGYIKFYNKAAADLWGRKPELGIDLWCGSFKIYEPGGTEPLPMDSCPMAIALKERRSIRGKEIVIERPDGERRNVMPYPDVIFDSSGEPTGAVNMLVDITDIRQKELALRESEDRYRQLSTELQFALKTEEEFISIASHELKTPITTINAFLQILLELHPEIKDSRTNYMLSRSKAQVDRLIGLIRDLLDVTNVQAGKLDLQFEEASLNEIVDDVISEYSSVVSSHTIIKNGKSYSNIYCDRHRIEQVISNLLTNATKYSKNADKVIIGISEDENDIQVDIQDFGIGIAKDDIPKVFDRFFRAHGQEGGMLSSLGLGLYISADIIKRHDGKIWVDSKIGKGSTFHFSLSKHKKL